MAVSVLSSLVEQAVPSAAAQVPRRRPGTGLLAYKDPRFRKLGKAEDSSTTVGEMMGLGPPKTEAGLTKSIKNMLDGPDDSIERLAFERDPQRIAEFAGVWRPKLQLIPDSLLKRMMIQDDLVAAIIHTRCNHVSQFGRKQLDRHQKGFKFEVDKGLNDRLDKDQKGKLQERIDRAEKLLLTCGQTEGWGRQDRCTFSEYLYMSTRAAIGLGRMATEVLYVPDKNDPTKRRFHSFRPTDAGTIYFAAPYKSAAEAVREQAKRLLEQIKNEKFEPEKFENDEYAWIQVIDGRPVQAFTPDEMLVQSFYPASDIEMQGYPITPLDAAISAVTTHINITNHNKLYFQSGRATRGMLIIKSADVDVETIQAVKQEFNASINAVHNSWRMPVFGIGPEDDLTWSAIDQGQRDMEFQFLSDSNARSIMAAFQMSPEELPGYQHLSRGTNNQALSESQNEYKLTAARDVGIRPLLAKMEDFLNDCIVPLIDPELSKWVKLRLIGLDVEDEEKESVRLQQDAPLHMTYDEVLEKVEKKPLGAALGGRFPLNPAVQAIIKQYLTFGQIQKFFFGVEDGDDYNAHPDWYFFEDEGWMAIHQEQVQMQAAQQQAQAQAAQQQPPTQGGGEQGQDLTSSVDQLVQSLGKSEKPLPRLSERLRAHVAATNKTIMDAWRSENKDLVSEIAELVDRHKPKS